MQLSVGDALLELVIARLGWRELLDERWNRRSGASTRQLAHCRCIIDLFHNDSRRRRSRVDCMVDCRLDRGADVPRGRLTLPFRSAQCAVEMGNLLGG